MKFTGVIDSDIIEVRFAFSGKISLVAKRTGDTVKSNEHIASLDRKLLQAELDRQLGDYERTRAEFDLFNLNAKESSDTNKFLKQQKQSALNTSVKDVEIAKYKLDQADLISPVAGVIIDDGGIVAGVNISPASNGVKILNYESLLFKIEIEQKYLSNLDKPRKVKISFKGMKKRYEGETMVPTYGKNGKFQIKVKLGNTEGLISGLIGEISF